MEILVIPLEGNRLSFRFIHRLSWVESIWIHSPDIYIPSCDPKQLSSRTKPKNYTLNSSNPNKCYRCVPFLSVLSRSRLLFATKNLSEYENWKQSHLGERELNLDSDRPDLSSLLPLILLVILSKLLNFHFFNLKMGILKSISQRWEKEGIMYRG